MKKIRAGSYANRRIELQMRDSKHSTLAKWTIAKRLVSETTCNHGVRFAECVILSGKALEGKQLTFSFQVVLFEFTGDRNILRKLLEYIK